MSISAPGNSGLSRPRLGMALRGPWPRPRSTAKSHGDQDSPPPALSSTSDAPVEPELMDGGLPLTSAAGARDEKPEPAPETAADAGAGKVLPLPAEEPQVSGEPQRRESGPRNQDSSEPSGSQVVTMAAKTRAVAQELILSGALDNLFANILSFLKKAEAFIAHAENGTGIINRIVNLVKEELQREMAKTPVGSGGEPGGSEAVLGAGSLGGLPLSSLQLVWNLIQTNEFQQLIAKMIAQALKPPPEGKPSPPSAS